MKIYTKTGDDGTTGLLGGGRVAKDSPRIVAYGTVDELNACIGRARVELELEREGSVVGPLSRVQAELFVVGAELADPKGTQRRRGITVSESSVAALEADIDRWEEALPALTSFVVPGGTRAAADLHVARTVCRRAERELLALSRVEDLSGSVAAVYLNRLADFLFVAARAANHEAGVPDLPWHPGH